jgi:hypothetical protein
LRPGQELNPDNLAKLTCQFTDSPIQAYIQKNVYLKNLKSDVNDLISRQKMKINRIIYEGKSENKVPYFIATK